MNINKNMSIKDILVNFPETKQVFENIGFNSLDNPAVIEKLSTISLEQAMLIKKQDIEIFIEMLEQGIDSKKNKNNNIPSITGLLPCPVRIPLLENFEKYLSENIDININYELRAASSGLSWIKDEVVEKNDIDKLSDMFISAGFDLFFDKDLIGKFKKEGIFKDLTGIKEYNKDFNNEKINLKDPNGDYSMLAVVPAIFIVNNKQLDGRKKPTSWADILKPEFKKSVSLPIADFDLFNSILIHIYKLYGEEGVRNLGGALLSNLHPAQMIEAREPAITIMPYFFSKMIPEKGPKEVVWPEEGAIISPIFMLTKKEKEKELRKVIDYMSGEKVGNILAQQGLFPSVHPNVKNPTNGKPLLWVGWDFIYSNDIGNLIKKCEKIFKEGVN